MLHKTRVVLVSLGLGLGFGVTGCNSFLTGDKLSNNPNSPGSATLPTLFVAMQAGQFQLHEGQTAMISCMWLQGCGATNGRFVEQLGRYDYGATEGAQIADWTSIYTGGGLVDLRSIEAYARANGDSVYLGVAKIWEAFTIGLASDMWSGIPYTQITTSATPDTDAQFVIYDAVQSLLSQAIRELTNDKVSSHGPLGADLVFGGLSPAAQRAAWIATAWSLKARYWLHAENAAAHNALPSGLNATQVYDSAIAAANNGISDPSGASDFRSVHFAPPVNQNEWSQFQTLSGFGADLEAGLPLVEYMKARNDPRLPLYFCPFVTSSWAGSTKYSKTSRVVDSNGNVEQVTAIRGDTTSGAAQPVWPTVVGDTTHDNNVTWTLRNITAYGGDSFNSVVSPDSVSNYACLPARFGPTAGVPYATYAETQLILAEACAQPGTTGCASPALTYLNNELADPGSASGVSVGALPAVSGVTGAALMDSIMMEKWVVMFQNIETLMDYRRTCIPAVTPVPGNYLSISFVPGRLFYPIAERNVNPQHIPLESTELAAGLRTQADVSTPCHP